MEYEDAHIQLYSHVDQRLGIMGENSKLAGLHIGKKRNIQGFFSLTKSQLMDLKSYYLVHLPFKTILLQSVQFVFMKFLPMQK